MKRGNADGFNKPRALAREERNQAMDRDEANAARYRLAMRVIWITLGIVCAVLGTVLLTILLK